MNSQTIINNIKKGHKLQTVIMQNENEFKIKAEGDRFSVYEVSDYYGLIGLGVDSVDFKEGEWYLNGIIEKNLGIDIIFVGQ